MICSVYNVLQDYEDDRSEDYNDDGDVYNDEDDNDKENLNL